MRRSSRRASGGVDSSVAAALIHRARLARNSPACSLTTACFASHGGQMVMDMFARNLGVKVIAVDASENSPISRGVTPNKSANHRPGVCRGFQAEAKKLPAAKWLAQGTIYPDVIESAGAKTKKAHTIKSHHNVGGLPETLNLAAGATARTVQGRSA